MAAISCLALLSLNIISTQAFAQDKTPEGKTLVKPPAATDSTVTQGPIVKDIEIEYAGPRSVDRSVVLSNMRTTIGQPYSLPAVEEDVRNLYATGLFVNLRIYDEPMADGVKVVVVVQPKPIVRDIEIVGAKEIKESRVRKEMKSKAGDPLSEQKVAEDSRKVLDYYRGKGFHQAQVEYKIDVNEQAGRAVVKYTIREGSKAWVRNVTFEGVKVFEQAELRKLFKTKKKDWISFFDKSGLLKEDQFKEDQKKLREYYQKHGYIDMQIQDIAYTYPEPEVIDIKITIFEGIQYHVGKINFDGNKLYTREQILARMKMQETGIFSPQGLDDDVKAIKDLYGEKGYIDANVQPQRQPNIESGKMDLVYKLDEAGQSFVEKIIVQGNNRTKDKVLRRELALAPGEVYDSVKADASKKRLENLGYFSKVDISAEDTAVPNRKDMLVTVEEQRTGSVTFGVGFSTVDSLLGFVELSQGNFDLANPPTFTGGGQKFRTRLQYGLQRRDFIISWTEPWFLDRQLSFGFDLFYNDSQYLSQEYNVERYGATIRLGKALNQFWRAGLSYTAQEIGIHDVDQNASQAIQQEAGMRSKSSIDATLTYDSRDSLTLSRKGEKVEFTAEGAGGPLLGDTKIWKLQVDGAKYFLLPYDLILSTGGATGVVDSYDNAPRVPLFDRYFIGGSRSVRGFDFRSIGPRDSNGEPIGGNTMAYGNVELTYPIMSRVRGAVFVDGGFDNPGVFDYSVNNLNVGTGFGLRLNLPIGPLRLDIGFPIKADGTSGKVGDVKFDFDVGYQF
ncbi:MAG: outer membrane protein assembly factor BamA [Methylacidiphilales bacterium]|nr:outer membrane protein assembly factor BamA [Candidatus Methylacidiphilales bacterium]